MTDKPTDEIERRDIAACECVTIGTTCSECMDQNPASDIERRAEDFSLEVFKELCPHTWKMPSGEPFPVDKSITRQAAVKGFIQAHSATKEEVEGLRKEQSWISKNFRERCDQVTALEAENAELKSNYWYRKAKGLATVADENKEIYRQLDALKKENEELSKEPLLVYGRKIDVLRGTITELKTAQKELVEALGEIRDLAETMTSPAATAISQLACDMRARHRKVGK